MPRGRSFGLAHAAEQPIRVGPEPLPLHAFLVRQPREGVPGVDARKVAVLKELPSEEVHLTAKGSSVSMAQGGPPWR